MTTPAVLVASWTDGVFVVTDTTLHQELAGQPVSGLAMRGDGGVLAIVGARSLCRRTAAGGWDTIAVGDCDLSCCISVGEDIYVGTADAQVLRLGENAEFERLPGLDEIAGRDKWYAGTALIDGRIVGPPLGIRSMTATCDAVVLLANVHVGGIPRSADGGVTWQPTIDIEHDVHQVCAHPIRPNVVVAAAASGLCFSGDGGATWSVEQDGLHTSFCSAVAFAGDDILVCASDGPFAEHGAVYRRSRDTPSPLCPVGGGLPRWIDGIVDTGCIAAHGAAIAVVDSAGNLYMSEDAGIAWSRRLERLPTPSGLSFAR